MAYKPLTPQRTQPIIPPKASLAVYEKTMEDEELTLPDHIVVSN